MSMVEVGSALAGKLDVLALVFADRYVRGTAYVATSQRWVSLPGSFWQGLPIDSHFSNTQGRPIEGDVPVDEDIGGLEDGVRKQAQLERGLGLFIQERRVLREL